MSHTHTFPQLPLFPAISIYIPQLTPTSQNSHNKCLLPGRILPYLKVVVNFHMIKPHFLHCPFLLDPHVRPQLDPSDPLFQKQNIGLSLTHLVPLITRPKIELTFHHNLSLDSF